MNQHLQTISNIIQQDKSLTVEEKNVIAKSLKDADKELEITAFKLDRTEKVKRTTAILLEETISELEQKRKAVEAQNRELEIEAALERVRSKAMAMHKSEDLNQAVAVVFDEMEKLGLGMVRCGIGILNKEKRTTNLFTTTKSDAGTTVQLTGDESMDLHPLQRGSFNAWLNGEDFSYVLRGKEIEEFYRSGSNTNFNLPNSQRLFSVDEGAEQHYHVSMFQSGGLYAFRDTEFSEEAKRVMKRFAGVFNLTYNRFLDLQKAEAQAREAKIETALERVRARTMAMQKSDELSETAAVLFQQFKELGEDPLQITIGTLNEAEGTAEMRITDPGDSGSRVNRSFILSIEEPALISKQFKAWKEHKNSIVIDLTGKELEKWINYRNKIYGIPVTPEDIKGRRVVSSAFFSSGMLSISTPEPPSQETIQLLERFANVFNLTYNRFLDLQKAEAQAREAKIELGLERVRARAMAMQRSDELKELIGTVFTELTKLDLVLTRCLIMIYDPKTNGSTWWMANSEAPSDPIGLYIKYHEHPPYLEYVKAWKEKKLEWQYILEGTVKKEWDDFLFVETELSHLPDFVIAGMKAPDRVYLNASFNTFGNLTLATLEPLSDEHFDILLRFAKVFDLTYTRFNDLKQAEAQARAAKIELGLERVRARAMAMQNSDELSDLVAILFEELIKLDMILARCIIWIFDSESLAAKVWMANSEDKTKASSYFIKYLDHPYYKAILRGWKERSQTWVYDLKGTEKTAIDQLLLNETELSLLPDAVKSGILNSKQTIVSGSFNNFGLIEASGPIPLSVDQLEILSRFAKVFDLTYTRFNDLKQAEAQAREAKIEASLERVRSKAMAMQKSKDLAEAVAIVFEELDKLNLGMLRCGIGILNKDKRSADVWTTTKSDNDTVVHVSGDESMDIHPLLHGAFDAWMNQADHYSYVLKGDDLNDYYKALTGVNFRLPDSQSLVSAEGVEQYYFNAIFSSGGLFAFSDTEFPEEAKRVMKRFANVFDLTYNRFLDLQKAEEQAREAKIETSLERVRAKAMAMHSSEELASTIETFYREIERLSVTPRRCGVAIVDKDTKIAELSTMNTTEDGNSFVVIGNIKMEGHKILDEAFEHWLQQKEYHATLRGPEIKEYYKVLRPQIDFPDYPNDQVQYGYYFMFREGDVYAWTDKPLTEEQLKIYRRFTSVLSLTFKRYNDLKHAEAQAREAQIEASLERVRSKAMAMHSSQDLADTIGVFYRELQSFGHAPRRCGVGLLKKEDRIGELFTWNTTPEGHSLELVGVLKMEGHPVLENVYDNWLLQREYHPVLKGKEIREYYQVLRPQIQFPDYSEDEIQYGYFFFFPEGGVYAWTENEMSEDELKIYRRFTSVLSLTYKRHKDLQQAEELALQAEQDLVRLKDEKKKTEEALSELKATQTQLIQSEKMASLGELTAGIAHEIQNPLNFVNNFAEVNKELLAEMAEEIEKGNYDEVKVLAKHVEENQEKINHHGKRAEVIVKGMLQHSRSSSGIKEPTDINKLADEYLRLAYHGLRAKDKSFNATLKTDFDESIANINIIPQDIGRVILNLITNAFYAVTAKKKQHKDNYEPTVSVATKKASDKVLISVKDNGNGIPEKVLDKIFQPFFTTKPTGQGTGLGLSLSYDIVKAHGGELKAKTKEEEGSEFIIQLPAN